MDFRDKLKSLRSLNRESEVHELLVDLLPKMGFERVFLTHQDGNQPEYGKDLVAATMDQIEGRYEWTAFVVKKGKISGSTGVVSTVLDQVKECFGFNWDSLHHGTVGMNKVKVVANGGIAAGARDKIRLSITSESPNVSFWDDETLVRFIDRHYENYWNRFITPVDFLKFTLAPGDGETIPFVADDDNVGRYELFTQDDASGVITFSLNGLPFREFGEPIVLNRGDTIVIRRAYTAKQGFSKWSGPRQRRNDQ